MKVGLKSILVLILISLASAMTSKKSNSRRYVFKTKYAYSSITLFDNGKFIQSKHSCTFAFTCKGHWTQNGDTINLNQEKFKNTRGNYGQQADRSNRLIILNDTTVNFLWNIELGFKSDFVLHLKNE